MLTTRMTPYCHGGKAATGTAAKKVGNTPSPELRGTGLSSCWVFFTPPRGPGSRYEEGVVMPMAHKQRRPASVLGELMRCCVAHNAVSPDGSENI